MRRSVFATVLCSGFAFSKHLNLRSDAEGPLCACSQLSLLASNATILPDNDQYDIERIRVWDKRADQEPACIFFPETAQQVAESVSILTSCDSQFAIRSGGHMNVSC